MNNQKPQNLYVGLGIIFGAAIGTVVGLLFLDGAIALGAAMGAGVGIVLGAIAQAQTNKNTGA